MTLLVSELVRLVVVCSFGPWSSFSSMVATGEEWHPPSKEHGGVEMGVSSDMCDNAKWKLSVDWDDSSDLEYFCQPQEGRIPVTTTVPLLSCLRNQDIPKPIHKCMTVSIAYQDEPPRGGPHRPLWPVYGEYRYVPPQRWVHSLEHGAIVFLYHPCADPLQVQRLKDVARSCLRRHIITPYRKLPRNQPLAVISYGCKMTMSSVHEPTVRLFVMENARNPKRASEANTWKDGQYSLGLLVNATVIPGSNVMDSRLCPGQSFSTLTLLSNFSKMST